jgi:sugar phosphate isomerase/epimerase
MKTIKISCKYSALLFFFAMFLSFVSCNTQPAKKMLVFKDYPNLKLGFSTQNFLKALPLNVAGLTEIIEYGSKEGYQFVEVRDQFVDLTNDDCKALAEVAKKNKMDLIYVFNKNPLDSAYFPAFEKALANVLVFPGPGILRAIASKSEFDADATKKGWTKDELTRLARLSDSCALICRSKNIRFVFENSNEAFFGDSLTYFGLTDFFANTSYTGLQFDIANPFRNSARVKSDPAKVLKYLSTMGNRWIETHLKTLQEGEPQPILTDNNPIPVEKVVELMGIQNVQFVTLELAAVEGKQVCFDNHAKSIKFLKDKGLLKE